MILLFFIDILFYYESFFFHYTNNVIYVFCTDFLCSGLYHDTNQRLCTTFSYKNTSICAECSCSSLYRFNNLRIFS